MKEFKHFGAYGLIVENERIVLIKKKGGPYDGKLDLPGGSLEFGETPEEALIRELGEEVGIKVNEYELFDANSVCFDWNYNDELLKWHHVGVFYKILSYDNEIKSIVELNLKNEDSLGAEFYDIDNLTKKDLSEIALVELEKLGYILKD